ncbi:uncharacterized protein LOC126843407 [Adelges cooleyi]|uniref:uncharacterized protein LOC126843407 n=1 Tax=Adelges cooleyi TaxID=133065 RepID=UPI00218037B5|nr:uncharacterized protein LOC126843407 [Adelges cooleyi]
MFTVKICFCLLNVLTLCVLISGNNKIPSYQVQEEDIPYSVNVINLKHPNHVKKDRPWNGRYLPDRTDSDHYEGIPKVVENDDFAWYNTPKRKVNVPTMGYMDINSTCDDGKTNLTTDWDGSFYNYTCLQMDYLPITPEVEPLLERDLLPKYYVANHVCMKENISYHQDIPSFGSHRPAWAKYGEYTFLPRQRWLHNLEHGAVVMLYHPCTHPILVQRMRTVLKGCLFRHIITPYNLVPTSRPIVLVTWGNRLYMNDVDTKLAVEYIKKYANHAKETTARDGQYDHLLLDKAEVISPDDVNICPTPHKRKNRI